MTNKRDSTIDFGLLVEQLGPINNKCRNSDGLAKVESLWDLGDTLLRLQPDANDQLLREIHDRSYITRDLMRYGLIVRRNWSERSSLNNEFRSLKYYSVFREALPFLKGDKCGIDDFTYSEVLRQVNSGDAQTAKAFLKNLKEEKIGKGHKKGKSRTKMAEAASILRTSFAELASLAQKEPSTVVQLCHNVGRDAVVRLAQASISLAEGSSVPIIDKSNTECGPLTQIREILVEVTELAENDRNGFRKAIGAVALMSLADLLNATGSEERLEQWLRRSRMDFKI